MIRILSWLKNKTLGQLQYWFSDRIARTYRNLHKQKLREMAENLPREILGINTILSTLDDNHWATYHLFKKARKKSQHAKAFLYFFYFFEISLKHLIISEMNVKNISEALSNIKDGLNFFSFYREEEISAVLDLGPTGEVIKKFLSIFPSSKIADDLWKINNERNYIIHNMLKRKMSEDDIEKSFERFFQNSGIAIKNTLRELDGILAKRPNDFLKKLKKRP